MIENFEDLKITVNDRLCYEQVRLNYNEDKVFIALDDFVISTDKNGRYIHDHRTARDVFDKTYEIFSNLDKEYGLNIKWHRIIDYYLHECKDNVYAFAIYKNKIEFIFSSGLYMIYKSNKNLIIKPKESNQKFFDKINKKFLIY